MEHEELETITAGVAAIASKDAEEEATETCTPNGIPSLPLSLPLLEINKYPFELLRSYIFYSPYRRVSP